MNARDSLVEWMRIYIRNEENTTLFNALQNFKEEKIKYNDNCLSTKLNITITLCVKTHENASIFQKGNEKKENVVVTIFVIFFSSKEAKKTYFFTLLADVLGLHTWCDFCCLFAKYQKPFGGFNRLMDSKFSTPSFVTSCNLHQCCCCRFCCHCCCC